MFIKNIIIIFITLYKHMFFYNNIFIIYHTLQIHKPFCNILIIFYKHMKLFIRSFRLSCLSYLSSATKNVYINIKLNALLDAMSLIRQIVFPFRSVFRWGKARENLSGWPTLGVLIQNTLRFMTWTHFPRTSAVSGIVCWLNKSLISPISILPFVFSTSRIFLFYSVFNLLKRTSEFANSYEW